jgi:two-component system nitrate/nitrite response regulator NarL
VCPAFASTRTGPIRVLLVDDQPLFQDALARAVRQDGAMELVGQAGDTRELVAMIDRAQPDVVLVDAGLLDDRAVRTARSARLLVLSGEVDAAEAYAAIESGAAGYLSKDADGARICRAVAAAARGETVLDPSVQTGLAQEIRLRVRDPRPVLTQREREILVLMADGRTAPEIAGELQLSPATVRTHVFHLYEKLGVAERAAAVAAAMRKGLVE